MSIEKDCGNLTAPVYGAVSYQPSPPNNRDDEKTKYGAEATYSCTTPGYELCTKCPQTVTCSASGEWDPTPEKPESICQSKSVIPISQV